MILEVEERLCRKFYFTQRARPDTRVTITKDTVHDATVLHLKKPRIFEIEIRATHPRSNLDESIFMHTLKATSTSEAVGTVTGNDQLLVQLAGEQRWGTER